MTPSEIREHIVRLRDWIHAGTATTEDLDAATIGALWEISAQLAELNERMAGK